ncbi:MerR family transcriptional regulator [Nocardioides sp.]|uniref:MerR family transcriptional regulator n=1 Tax=Nocardioides sp. TaxID=35761 RepID=UPI003D0F6119
MRISELSEQADLPVGTVKFYLRSGLLHQGQLVSATQAEYDETHLERLRLIRALLEVGHLTHAEIQGILDALAKPPGQMVEALVQVYDAAAKAARYDETDLTPALAAVRALGWSIDPESPHLAWLARAISALESIGLPPSGERMQVYGAAALLAAENDIDWVMDADPDRTVLRAIGSSVLWGSVLGALRVLAAEDVSRRQFGEMTMALRNLGAEPGQFQQTPEDPDDEPEASIPVAD